MTIMRLTGTAGMVHTRSGVKKIDGGAANGGEDRAWEMRSQDVEIAQFVSTRVDLSDSDEGFTRGEVVDLAVEVTAQGSFLRVQIKGDWPKDTPVSKATPTPARVPASV